MWELSSIKLADAVHSGWIQQNSLDEGGCRRWEIIHGAEIHSWLHGLKNQDIEVIFSFLFWQLNLSAALFVDDCLSNSHRQQELKDFLSLENKEHVLPDLLKTINDKVVKKEHGHLDFLRFILGLIVESDRRVLCGLLESGESNQETVIKIAASACFRP